MYLIAAQWLPRPPTFVCPTCTVRRCLASRKLLHSIRMLSPFSRGGVGPDGRTVTGSTVIHLGPILAGSTAGKGSR